MVRVKTFAQFLLPYLVVLSIPVLLLSFILFRFAAEALGDEIRSRNMDNTRLLADTVDECVIRMNEVAGSIAMNPVLRPSQYGDSEAYASMLKGIAALRMYQSPMPYVLEMIVYYPSSETMFGSESSYTRQTFLEGTYKFTGLDEPSLNALLHATTENRLVLPSELYESEKEQRCFLYVRPLGKSMGEALVIYVVDLSYVRNVAIGYYKDGETATAILQEDGELVAAFGNTSVEMRESFRGLKRELPGEWSKVVSVSGKRYLTAGLQSPYSRLTYVTAQPEEVMLKPVQLLIFIAFVAILLILTIGAMVIYWAMRKNYLPISRLESHFRGAEDGNVGSFALINNGIEALENQLAHLKQKILHSRSAYRHHALLELLNGTYSDRREFEEVHADSGILLKNPWYVCAHVLWSDAPAGMTPTDMVDAIATGVDTRFEVHGMAGQANDRLILLVAMPLPDQARSVMEQVLEILQNHSCVGVKINVAQVVDRLGALRESYATLAQVNSYRFIHAESALLLFEDTLEYDRSAKQPGLEREIGRLEAAIREGNGPNASREAEEIYRLLAERNRSLLWVRIQTYELVRMVTGVINSMNMPFGSNRELVTNGILAITESSSIEDFRFLLDNVITDVTEMIRARSQGGIKLGIEQVMEEIDRTCFDYSFSVARLAEELSVSKAHLSRVFKEHTGRTIIEHVNHLRLNRAKDLLTRTEHTVSHIVDQIGFIDVSSFTKKFRVTVGMTPLTYRNESRKSE